MMHINNDLIKIPTVNTSAQVNSSYAATTLLWGYITGGGDLRTNYIGSGNWIHINITYITSA